MTVITDISPSMDIAERNAHTAHRLLEAAVTDAVDIILFLEDDIDFNRHLRANLTSWPPIVRCGRDDHLYASLYNPGIPAKLERPEDRCFVAQPHRVDRSQALVISAATARLLLDRWHLAPGAADVRMARLAANVTPILYHCPSLVEHVGFISTVGWPFHQSIDFSRDWRPRV